MSAITTVIQYHPDNFATEVAKEVLRQLSGSGTAPAGLYITPDDLPTLSAADAAQVLGCSNAKLDAMVMRWPEYIKPIIEVGKSKRYKTEEILKAKQMNLKKRKP